MAVAATVALEATALILTTAAAMAVVAAATATMVKVATADGAAATVTAVPNPAVGEDQEPRASVLSPTGNMNNPKQRTKGVD